MKEDTETSPSAPLASSAFDPLEDGVRQRVRRFIETILEEELRAVLGRGRYERSAEGATGHREGHRNGHRERQVIGTFGAETVKVPRARLVDEAGGATEWRSQALHRYQRLTKKAEALIASVNLAGTNTRRVKRRPRARSAGACEGAAPRQGHRGGAGDCQTRSPLAQCRLPADPPGQRRALRRGRSAEANDLTVGIMAPVAQAEREAISTRTKEALSVARSRGVRLGNPNGAAALRRAGKGAVAFRAAVGANAERHAQDLAPVVADIRASVRTACARSRAN